MRGGDFPFPRNGLRIPVHSFELCIRVDRNILPVDKIASAFSYDADIVNVVPRIPQKLKLFSDRRRIFISRRLSVLLI